MDEYLIQGSTLTDIADAIREKTGDDALMTPAEMVEAIGSISGSGGELLVDYVAPEDVATINLVIPDGKKSYRVYVVELIGRTSANEWVYPRLNTTTTVTTGPYLPLQATYNSKFVVTKYAYGDGGFAIVANYNNLLTGTSSPTLNNIHLNLYYQASVFRVGFEAKVWGYDI